MKEVLLILAPTPNLLSRDLPQVAGVLPLGLAYIAAVLQENEISIDVLDLFNRPISGTELSKIFKQEMPRIIGISSTTENITNALRIASLVKQIDSSIIVILGGPHVTFMAKETLQNKAVDVVVHREGEFAMLELANCFLRGLGTLERIQGISYREKNGRIMSNNARGFIENLDELAFPARALFSKYRYATTYEPFITSRGCPQRCIFCSASAMGGGRYRMRTAEHVIDEIMFLHQQEKKGINFSDDTMTGNIQRFNAICDYIKALNFKLNWVCESRVDVMNKFILERMVQLGCVSIQFGIESGSQEVLNLIHKNITLEQIDNAVHLARECGIKLIICGFMVGHPYDTEESVMESIHFAVQLQKKYGAEVRFFVCTPYPGTFLYERANDLGLHLLSHNYEDYNYFNPVYNSMHLTHNQIRNLHFRANAEVIKNLPKNVADNIRNLHSRANSEERNK